MKRRQYRVMGARNNDKLNSIRNYERLLEKQVGKAVRPFRADSYVNLLNKYGTSKDTSEHYHFQQEPPVPDDMLTAYYEGNGLFAKIIDTPAEEAVKHGFELEAKDQTITDFYTEALDELDWEEKLMTAIKWTRLFGGCIVVMLIDDGRGLDEPLDWHNIKSIDDLRIYDRSLIQEDTSSMFDYRPDDPFRAKGSRLGMPEYYDVFSKYGNFRVHDSRCLVFQNGTLPENTTNSIYQLWGMPEYVRINKAIRDAEVAHGSAIKLLDRSVQAVYRMKDLSAELATAEGEDRVLRRLQTIDMARGLLNSITIDADGEDYGFQTFQFSGVSTVVDSACNYLSALTSIPQTLLFGRSPAGMNSTGESDLENWYNYVERIQSRMIKKNLRYLLSVIFQAGVANGEIDEVPEIKIEFNPLWSMSESEKAAVEQQKAATQQTKAQTAQIYMDAQVIDPSEVRRKLADSGEFDVETMLDEYDEEELFENMPQGEDDDMLMGGEMPPTEQAAEETEGTEQEVQESEQAGGNTDSADTLPNLNKPSQQSAKRMDNNLSTPPQESGSVGVLVVKDGNILTGTRKEGFKQGQICGPGGHVEDGESLEEAAIRETQEEFGITPTDMVLIGYGPMEKDTGLKPAIFLATEYEGEIANTDGEIGEIAFRDMREIETLGERLFRPFKDSCKLMTAVISDDIKATKPNDLLTPDDLFREFTKMMPNSAINKPKPTDKLPQPCYNNNIPNNPYRQAFQSLSAEDIAYMMDEFGIDVGAATDDELLEVVAKLREDGAPKGNQNAAGPHKRQHLSSEDKKKYSKRIVGQKTSDGVEVKGFSNHAYDRIAQRNLSPKRIENMLQSSEVSADKKHPDTRRCYDTAGSRLVLDHTNGTIVTIEWRSQNK